MLVSGPTLEALDAHYSKVLALTPAANRIFGDMNLAMALRDEYAVTRFVKLPDVVPPESLTALVTTLLPVFRAVAEEVRLRQAPDAVNKLSDGARFRRIDPYCLEPSVSREKMTQLLEQLGLAAFGNALAKKLTPLIRFVAGAVRFERFYFYLYDEGDYITAHDDHHVGNRVDVQFPVTVGSVGGLRVLCDGFLRMHYDAAGDMNVLGPSIWHDVPPLLRIHPGPAPARIVLGFRFTKEQT